MEGDEGRGTSSSAALGLGIIRNWRGRIIWTGHSLSYPSLLHPNAGLILPFGRIAAGAELKGINGNQDDEKQSILNGTNFFTIART